MHRKQLIILVVALVAIIGAFAAIAMHGNKAMDMTPSTQGAAATDKVTIHSFMFNPMVISVKVGTTVTWTNTDSVNHTVAADTVSADAPSSMDIADGKSYSFTFKKAGTYTYHCFPHPYMHGTVVVKG